jgi:hypothetical protein
LNAEERSVHVFANGALRTELIVRESCEETARLSAVEAAEIDGDIELATLRLTDGLKRARLS